MVDYAFYIPLSIMFKEDQGKLIAFWGRGKYCIAVTFVVGRRVIARVETLSCSILLVVQGHLLSAAAWARPSVYLFGNKSLPSGNKDIRSALSASSFT